MLEKNNKKLSNIVNAMIKQDRVRDQDVLYFLGKVPELKMLNNMKNEFTKIDLQIDENLFGKDDLKVFVPIKWIISDFDNFNIGLKIRDFNLKPTSMESDRKRNGVVYSFEDAIKIDDALQETNSLNIGISLNHPSGSYKIDGLIKNDCKKVEKGILSLGVDKAKNLTGKLLGSDEETEQSDKETVCEPDFMKEKIVTSKRGILNQG